MKFMFQIIVLIIVGIGIVFSLAFHYFVKEDNNRMYENLTDSQICRTIPMKWSCWLKETQVRTHNFLIFFP